MGMGGTLVVGGLQGPSGWLVEPDRMTLPPAPILTIIYISQRDTRLLPSGLAAPLPVQLTREVGWDSGKGTTRGIREPEV